MKWVVQYDETGLVICEICGKSFKKLWSHLRWWHKILTEDYKREQWLNQSQSLMCTESIELARANNKENYELVVGENLKTAGVNTRFKKWYKGRPKSKISIQEMNRIKTLHKSRYISK